MIQRLVLKEGHVKFVCRQGESDMLCQVRVPLDGRKSPRTAAFIRNGIGVADAQSKMGVVVKEE